MTVVEQPQHLKALDRANDTRLWRAAMKRRVCAGETTVEEVLTENDPRLATMAIGELLAAQRRWKDARTTKFLNHVPGLSLGGWRPVREITQRQLKLLIAALQEV